MRRIAAAIVGAGAVIAIGLWFGFLRSPGPGPLAWSSDFGQSWVTATPKPGQLEDSALIMPRSLTVPAVLLDVQPASAEDARGLDMRYAATIGYGIHIGGASGLRPKKWVLHPLKGFVIPPHVRGAVMVGASPRKPGVYFLHAFVVTYRVGDTTYRTTLQQGMKLCVEVRYCPPD